MTERMGRKRPWDCIGVFVEGNGVMRKQKLLINRSYEVKKDNIQLFNKYF